MPQGQLGNYFRVSKSGRAPSTLKRAYDGPEISELDSPKTKRPAHARFAHLTQVQAHPEVVTTDEKTVTSGPQTVCKPTQKLSVGVTRPPNKQLKTKKTNVSVHAVKTVGACDSHEIENVENVSHPPSIPAVSSRQLRPAHKRFAYLAEAESLAKIELQTPEAIVEPKSTVSNEVELTQTEVKIPAGLLLPTNFQILLDLFRSCDTVVSMLHNRAELCTFDKLKPAVQEIVRRNFEETHVGQFLSVYPMVYNLRYEKQLDKFTRRPTECYVLALTPNLRTDGTQIGHNSPSKGHLVFTGTRLIQRRNRFHRLLLGHVFRAHRDFLQNSLCVDLAEIPNDTELRRWHPRFRLDSVADIRPSPLPCRPGNEQKVCSAKDAVKAFQARALFREAEICQTVADRRHNNIPSIPSPSKASACSPRKLNVSEQPPTPKLPSAALFSSTEQTTSLSPFASSLRGVSEKLLAKVRAKENERRLLTQLTQNCIPESRRIIYSRLPSIVTQVWTAMRSTNSRPVTMNSIAQRVADAHSSGLSADAVNEHLRVLLEFCPQWLEKLDWSSPHLRIRDQNLTVKDVIDSVKTRLAAVGFYG